VFDAHGVHWADRVDINGKLHQAGQPAGFPGVPPGADEQLVVAGVAEHTLLVVSKFVPVGQMFEQGQQRDGK
jgi:hypothetical protein